ncbi:Chromosome partition protein Smc [compost metagenome]
MIPWEMKISGIRDYPATVLDLSGMMEHILITGPNGSGKSTLTFCMGAVLGSAKVELEGLRSKNIGSDEVWHAQIHLVFANIGEKPVDAARYVQFSLHMEQKPGEPLKRQYWIREGEQVGAWERETRYTTGDGVNHLREYRYQLQHKYVVDPDAFYLIWYQQDVNQFATMRPEERFRIFSEMTRIDNMQRTWESAKERLKEAERARQEAENNQLQHKFDLERWQKERDRLLARNQNRLDNLSLFMHTSAILADRYKGQQQELSGQLEQLDIEYDDTNERKSSLTLERERLEEARIGRENQKQALELKLEAAELQIIGLRKDIEVREKEHAELVDRLQMLADQIRSIPLNQEDVIEQLGHSSQMLEQSRTEVEMKREELQLLQELLDDHQEAISHLNVRIDQDREEEKRFSEVLQEYRDSAQVQQQLELLESRYVQLQDQIRHFNRQLEQLAEEESSLKSDRILSRRQEQSVKLFSRMGIQVYTMQQLLEMDSRASLEQEFVLEAVKYTVFVESRSFIPPNDLIHVELPSIVPERSIERLADLQVQAKENLSDDMYAAALKVMWWLHELLLGVRGIQLRDGILLETGARRGAQEERQWLLHTKGMQIRLQRLQEEKEKLKKQLITLTSEWELVNQQLSLYRSALPLVQQAEAFFADSAERELRIRQLSQYTAEREQKKNLRYELDQEISVKRDQIAELAQECRQLEKYLDIYKQYEHEREQVEQLRLLEHELKELYEKRTRLELEIRELDSAISGLETSIESTKRRLRDKRSSWEEAEAELEQIRRQQSRHTEECEAIELNQARIDVELKQWQEKLAFMWEEAEALFSETDVEEAANPVNDAMPQTEAALMSERERARIHLQNACNEIVNEYAIDNYERTKEAYDRGAEEVQNAKLLMEQLDEQLQELEDKLFNTIRNEVHRVNTKFVMYMDRFGFDGEVAWQHQEGKHGELRYYLYVRARKQGHRGDMEEVSLKGRGNKVGKGVSGGEESLSSLLFALALLKTIDSNPGYIILDEFDSALDESRKAKVFELYEQELVRKMIILSPKSQNNDYLAHFNKAFVVYHDPTIPQSQVIRIRKNEHA